MTGEPAKGKSVGVDWIEVYRRMALIQEALDQGLAPGSRDKKLILKQRAKILARDSRDRENKAETIDLVTFQLADEKYGIESRHVQEVYSLKELTPVPCTPAFVLGITSVRGKIVSVIDIKKFFDLPFKGLNELDKIVIVQFNRIEVGIRADVILGVQQYRPNDAQTGLPTLTGIRERYLKGITPERLIILDIPKLLTDQAIIINEEVED